MHMRVCVCVCLDMVIDQRVLCCAGMVHFTKLQRVEIGGIKAVFSPTLPNLLISCTLSLHAQVPRHDGHDGHVGAV